jgi:8-oxo-dGTP diphosphatase
MAIDPARYPLLFRGVQETTWWGGTTMRFVFEPEPPISELIGNVRCACFSGDRVVVIKTEEFGLSAFPGGVLEPGEDWKQALARELLEEAGARPLAVEVVGRIHFWSGFDAPYRPHLPHPEFQQVVTYADIELVGSPSNPPDGEHVLSVESIPTEEAVERLRATDPFDADLLAFVTDVRSGKGRPDR